MIGCSCCVLASFPGPAQLSVACSTVRAQGESGNETSGVHRVVFYWLILDWVKSSLHFMLNYEKASIVRYFSQLRAKLLGLKATNF